MLGNEEKIIDPKGHFNKVNELKEVSPARHHFIINHLNSLLEKMKEKPGQEANVAFYEDVIFLLKKLIRMEELLRKEKVENYIIKDMYLWMLERSRAIEQRALKYESLEELQVHLLIDETHVKLLNQLVSKSDKIYTGTDIL